MSRIWAVAAHMIAEGIRMKIALVFIALLVIVLPTMPFTLAGDGLTLTSKVQSFLSYAFNLTGFLLSLLTIFLACGGISNEVRQKYIFMIASKPIPRWQFFAGKWLGIVALSGILLLASGAMVWGFTMFYLKNRPTFHDDRMTLNSEVLTVRYGAKPARLEYDRLVEHRIRQLREEGRLEDASARGIDDLRAGIREELRKADRTIGPGQFKLFVFRDLLVDREEEGYVHLQFKPHSPSGVEDVIFRARWQAGDPDDVNTLTVVQQGEFIVDRYHSIPIPLSSVNKEGTLYVRMQNADPKETIIFEGDDGIELLFGIGTFHWNLFRGLTIIWTRLAFLAFLGLLMSTFLSFPVACMICFLTLMVASASGFLTEAIEAVNVRMNSEDPLWILGPLLRPLAHGFVFIVPDFSKFDPIGTIVAGRVVPLYWVMQSLLMLIFLKGLLLGVLGAVLFSRKELAQVTV